MVRCQSPRQGSDCSALAEDCYDQAGELAREQGALFWELRIALSLARLRVSQGRDGEARKILELVYHRLTEGSGTTDLPAARSMLERLPLQCRSRIDCMGAEGAGKFRPALAGNRNAALACAMATSRRSLNKPIAGQTKIGVGITIRTSAADIGIQSIPCRVTKLVRPTGSVSAPGWRSGSARSGSRSRSTGTRSPLVLSRRTEPCLKARGRRRCASAERAAEVDVGSLEELHWHKIRTVAAALLSPRPFLTCESKSGGESGKIDLRGGSKLAMGTGPTAGGKSASIRRKNSWSGCERRATASVWSRCPSTNCGVPRPSVRSSILASGQI